MDRYIGTVELTGGFVLNFCMNHVVLNIYPKEVVKLLRFTCWWYSLCLTVFRSIRGFRVLNERDVRLLFQRSDWNWVGSDKNEWITICSGKITVNISKRNACDGLSKLSWAIWFLSSEGYKLLGNLLWVKNGPVWLQHLLSFTKYTYTHTSSLMQGRTVLIVSGFKLQFDFFSCYWRSIFTNFYRRIKGMG